MTQTYKPNKGQLRIREEAKRDDITRLLVYSGSRSGKTFELIRTLIIRALLAENSRQAVIRKNFSQIKKYIWLDTLPEVLGKCFPKLKNAVEFNKTDYFLKFPNSSEIWMGGLDDKDRADKILGGEYNSIYFNECSEISYNSILTALTRLAKKSKKADGRSLVNKAYFDENPPAMSHWSYKLFFEGIDPITRNKLDLSNYEKVFLTPEDNAENLSEGYIENLKSLPGDARKRFYEGAFQSEVIGALWTQELINKHRKTKGLPEMKRIVIAVDPAVTNSENSDETGIVVDGLGVDNHAYVLDDLSGYYSPAGWADMVATAYDKWRADAVVGEKNNGGDLVQSNIQSKRPDIPFHEVWASRGKIKRAEPVSSLYERGLVHHTKDFVDLEYQMISYTGQTTDDSPDRMDANVYGITELANPPQVEDIVEDDGRVSISTV